MDIVVVGGGPWAPDTNFPTHHTARILARSHRVLYLFRDSHTSLLGKAGGRLPGFHSWRELGARATGGREIQQVSENLWVCALSGLAATLPLSYPPAVRSMSVRAVIGQLNWALRKLHFDRPLLWFYWWFFPEIVQAIPHRFSVYDMYDDHTQYDFIRADPARQRYTGDVERRLLREVDLALAVSRKLEREKAGDAPVKYLPNGADIGLAQSAAERPPPGEMSHFPRPIVGYLGSYDSRLDWPLTEGLAAARPDWSFVFVGGGTTAPSRRHPNLHLLGNRDYTDALTYVNGFDLALIPFVRDALTDAVCPAKLFDYLALGKPILSTPIPAVGEIVGDTEAVYRAEGIEGFLEAAERALVEPASLKDSRQALARSLTWEKRMETAMAWIDEAMSGRAA